MGPIWNSHFLYSNLIKKNSLLFDSFILGDIDKYNKNYFYSYIFGKDKNGSERDNSNISIVTGMNDINDNDSTVGNLVILLKIKNMCLVCIFIF